MIKKSFKTNQPSMTVTEKKKKEEVKGKLSMKGENILLISTVKVSYLTATPILTLLYTGHRPDEQQKRRRGSRSENTTRVPPQPYLTAPLAPSGAESDRQRRRGRTGAAAAGRWPGGLQERTSHQAISDLVVLEVAAQTVLVGTETEIYLQKFQRT